MTAMDREQEAWLLNRMREINDWPISTSHKVREAQQEAFRALHAELQRLRHPERKRA